MSSEPVVCQFSGCMVPRYRLMTSRYKLEVAE
jgi:hypothetical protein